MIENRTNDPAADSRLSGLSREAARFSTRLQELLCNDIGALATMTNASIS